jgi:phage terminase large subunit-like protein
LSHLDGLTKGLVQHYADKLSEQEQMLLAEALQVVAHDIKYNKFAQFFPDEGEFARDLYPKHTQFFNAGEEFMERGFIAANRVGKSEAGAYEMTCHATGEYPEWWTGWRLDRPGLLWVGGDTGTTVRDIIQKKLVGDDIHNMGSGMLPKDKIIVEKCKTRRNVPEALEIIKVRHVSGGESTIVLKTYEAGRATWQGTEVDFIWMDEECPEDVYSEALIRIMTTKGRIITTFTPLRGLTELVLGFLENSQEVDGVEDPVHVTIVAWDDVPHLGEDEKRKLLKRTPPQLRDARSKGIPTVGEGLVYPIDPANVTCEDFPIPHHYKRLYGMDVGWNMTAAIFGALDAENDIVYIYSEHRMGEEKPVVHAKAIKARGNLRGEIDPASRGRSQVDGEKLFMLYTKDEGLNLVPANNAVEAGVFEIWDRFTTGRLKIMKSCTGLLRELSLYHRDEKGKIVKRHDHCLDALRYLMNAPASHWQYPKRDGDNSQKKKVVEMKHYMNACT